MAVKSGIVITLHSQQTFEISRATLPLSLPTVENNTGKRDRLGCNCAAIDVYLVKLMETFSIGFVVAGFKDNAVEEDTNILASYARCQ